MSENSSVQSVSRAFSLIELICTHGPLGITELSVLSGLNKTTVFRLLSTLCELSYVRKNEKTEKYELTLKFLKLSSKTLCAIDIRRYARPHLERLSDLTGETVHLVERNENEIIYIDKYESMQNSVRMVSRIGLSLPIVYTAVGKAIMAKLPIPETKSIWNSTRIEKKTPFTVTDYEEFLNELEAIKKSGFATDMEENEEGVRCVAAAIPDIYGEYKYALSVSAPASRMNEKKLKETAKLVLEAASNISK